jgi:hypothetical protein
VQPPIAEAKPDWLTAELEETLKLRNFPLNKDGMLMLWNYSKEKLQKYKELEMDYRKIAVKLIVPNATEGMNTVDLGNGFQAKAQVKFNYKLDNDNEKVWTGLENIARIGNEGKFIADRLVSWTPNFLLTEYRTLQEEAEKDNPTAKAILKEVESFLTITDVAPTLEIKKAKEGKK